MNKKTQLNMMYAGIAVFVIILLQSWLAQRGVEVIPYSEFEQLLKDNQIKEVYIRQDYLEGTLHKPLADGGERFITTRVDPQLADRLSQGNVKFTGVIDSTWLRTLLSWDGTPRGEREVVADAVDPVDDWRQARRQTFESRQVLFWASVAAFGLLLARASERQPEWVAAILSLGLVPVAGELTGYYYAVFLAFGFLWIRRESIGVALCALSALTWLFVEVWHWTDVILTWTSLAFVVFVAYAAIDVLRSGRTAPPTSG